MSYLVVTVVILTVALAGFGQVILKLAVIQPAMIRALQSGMVDALFSALISPLIWLGILAYGVCFAMWLWILSKVELSLVYPFVGLSFLVTMVLGALVLNENVSPIRILGTVLIAGGCILVGRSA